MAEGDNPNAFFSMTEWITVKKAQFDRIAGQQPGLQLIRYGHKGTIFMLVKSTPQFYEAVVYGQNPIEIKVENRKGPRRYTRPATEEEKPIERRSVDLVDAEMQSILETWSRGKSALTLPFVPYIYDRDGKLRTAKT